jgi:hypothetical protein
VRVYTDLDDSIATRLFDIAGTVMRTVPRDAMTVMRPKYVMGDTSPYLHTAMRVRPRNRQRAVQEL